MLRSQIAPALVLLILAPATESTFADDLPGVVATLVEQLDADQRSTRREAERALTALGPAALPHLPASDLLPTVSSREAVRRVRLLHEHERAEASVRATTVTLDGRQTLRNWLAEVTAQTGNRIDASRLEPVLLDREVTFDVAAMPFWEFVDEELRPLGITLAAEERDGDLVLLSTRPATTNVPMAVTRAGAFRVTLGSLRRRPLFGDDREDLLRATMHVRAEPRLRPLFLKYGGHSFEVTRANGTVVPPFDPDASHELPLGGRVVSPRFDVRWPKGPGEATVSLAGRFVVTVAAGEERIAFPSLAEARGVARRRGGVTVRVTGVEFAATDGDGPSSSRARVAVEVAYDTGGPAFESHRTWVFHNRAYLEDEAGRIVPFDGAPTTTQQNDGAVAVRYEFADLTGRAADYHFVYAAPTLVIDVPLEVVWKGLAVPGDVGAR